MNIDFLIQNFIKEREQGIKTLHNFYFQSKGAYSFKEDLINELKEGCISFFNKNYPFEELNDYLFHIVNDYCKLNGKTQVKIKQHTEYICPACIYLNNKSILNFNYILHCNACENNLKSSNDPKYTLLYKTFHKHNKRGYHCPDCQRFIPHPLDNSSKVSCPYFDCYFVGNVDDLEKMNHPTIKSNAEKLISNELKDNIINNVVSDFKINEDLKNKLSIIKDVIETQNNNVPYSGSDSTVKHKQCVYNAFSNILDKDPENMVNYILNNGANHSGFQNKIFQEYIKILEESLPFPISKNKKVHKIDNLLDDNLCLFDGISVFESVISDKLNIKNETKEFYIGGRKASYAKPFYIGKLLSVINSENKESLLHLVKNYSFSKIYMHDISPGTKVTVTHLRVPPHFQMGGMVYVNRIRKKIVDSTKLILNVE